MLAMRAYMFVIFLGHFVGLLTPIQVFDALGISHTSKQWMAIGVGGLGASGLRVPFFLQQTRSACRPGGTP